MSVNIKNGLDKALISEVAKIQNDQGLQEALDQLNHFTNTKLLLLWEHMPLQNLQTLPASQPGSSWLTAAWAKNPGLTSDQAEELWARAFKYNFFLTDQSMAWTVSMLVKRYQLSWQHPHIQKIWEVLIAEPDDPWNWHDPAYALVIKMLLEIPALPADKERVLRSFPGLGGMKATFSDSVQAGYLLAQSGPEGPRFDSWADEFRQLPYESKQQVYKKSVDLIFHQDPYLSRYGLDWSLIDPEWLKDAWHKTTIASSPMTDVLRFLEEPKRSELVELSVHKKFWDILGYWLDRDPDLSTLSKSATVALLGAPSRDLREKIIARLGVAPLPKSRGPKLS